MARLGPFLPPWKFLTYFQAPLQTQAQSWKVLGIIHPAHLSGEGIRFGEGELGTQAFIKHNHGVIYHAKDFKITSFCPCDNHEVGIIFPT